MTTPSRYHITTVPTIKTDANGPLWITNINKHTTNTGTTASTTTNNNTDANTNTNIKLEKHGAFMRHSVPMKMDVARFTPDGTSTATARDFAELGDVLLGDDWASRMSHAQPRVSRAASASAVLGSSSSGAASMPSFPSGPGELSLPLSMGTPTRHAPVPYVAPGFMPSAPLFPRRMAPGYTTTTANASGISVTNQGIGVHMGVPMVTRSLGPVPRQRSLSHSYITPATGNGYAPVYPSFVGYSTGQSSASQNGSSTPRGTARTTARTTATATGTAVSSPSSFLVDAFQASTLNVSVSHYQQEQQQQQQLHLHDPKTEMETSSLSPARAGLLDPLTLIKPSIASTTTTPLPSSSMTDLDDLALDTLHDLFHPSASFSAFSCDSSSTSPSAASSSASSSSSSPSTSPCSHPSEHSATPLSVSSLPPSTPRQLSTNAAASYARDQFPVAMSPHLKPTRPPPPPPPAATATTTPTHMVASCKLEGCDRRVRSRGFCKTHGGGKKCSIPGCLKSSQNGAFCIGHGGGKKCRHVDCAKAAQSHGLCKAHGGGARCKHPSCDKSSQGGGLCRAHGGGKRCQAPQCVKGAQRGDFCATHGGFRNCGIQGCVRTDRGGGFCEVHRRGRLCKVGGCKKLARNQGMCTMHIRQVGGEAAEPEAVAVGVAVGVVANVAM